MTKPIRVGITGGIGSGKSTICRVFECLDIPVYYADDRAKWLASNHADIVREVKELLGKEAYLPDGSYNTRFVASRVFGDKGLLDSLNEIIHPRVKEDTLRWIEEHQNCPYVLKEAAIMSKAGESSGLDYVLAVVSPQALRIQRVLARDPHRTEEQVKSIIANQITEDSLLEIADFVVRNDEVNPIIPQVLSIHHQLLECALSS